jgi:hypothetical protein
LRDFPDIHSASSAKGERHERVRGRSHSIPRRRDALVVDVETDVEHGCLLKSMVFGTVTTGFHVTRLTEASFIVSTQKHSTPSSRQEASDNAPKRLPTPTYSAPSLLPDDSDPDLAAVVDAWPSLPEALKSGILALVKPRLGGITRRRVWGCAF